MLSRTVSKTAVLIVLLTVGCGGPGKDDVSKERLAAMAGGTLKETTAVSGKVLLDGAPKEDINVLLYTESGEGPINNCMTDKEGKYCWSTNLACDGLEAGSYRLGFKYIPDQKKNDSGVDVFKGKYNRPRASEFKLTVQAGTPQVDVNYELKTK